MPDWSLPFEDEIALPDGRTITTLRQAGEYVAALPKRTQSVDQWQLAAEMLLLAAERRIPLMMARIAMLKALNHGKNQPRTPRTRTAKTYRIIS